MDDTGLDDHDRLLAELYGLKVAFMSLLTLVFEANADPQGASERLACVVSDSIDVFKVRGAPAFKEEMIREAMRERALAIVSSAANPRRS